MGVDVGDMGVVVEWDVVEHGMGWEFLEIIIMGYLLYLFFFMMHRYYIQIVMNQPSVIDNNIYNYTI